MIISFQEYCEIIDRYFLRLYSWEKHKVRETYYNDYIENFDKKKLLKYDGLRFAIIKGFIEYGFPFTLEDVIFLPFNKINDAVIKHEYWHIYFRYYYSEFLNVFCKKFNIVKINRKIIKGEITNPDTDYFTGLVYENIIIFCVLFHKKTNYKVKYYVSEGRKVRRATNIERDIYNEILNFNQNYHPEEIIASHF